LAIATDQLSDWLRIRAGYRTSPLYPNSQIQTHKYQPNQEETKMKKIWAIVLMSLMIVSMVPAVFADEHTNDIDEIRVDKRVKREIAPFTGRVSDDVREKRAERIENIREKRAERVEKVLERRENAVEKRTKARELSRTKIKLHREKLVVAKEKAAVAKERYKDSKGKAVAARKRLADCDADVQDCAAVQAEFTGHFKDALLRTIEHLGDIVDQVEARIASSEDVTEGESSEELARISELRLQLQELASQVGQLPEDADKSELRAIVKAVKNELRDIQKDLKHSASVVVSGRLGGIIVRAGQMETKLDQVLAWADKKGIAVGDIDALVDIFHNHLVDAKDAFEDAESARRNGNKEAFVENLKASKNSLKEAHSVLTEIMKGIRQYNLEEGLEETETVKPTSNEADEVDEEEVEEEDEETEEEDESELEAADELDDGADDDEPDAGNEIDINVTDENQ